MPLPDPMQAHRPTQRPRSRSGRQRIRSGAPVQPWTDNVFNPPQGRHYSPYAVALTLSVHLAPLLLLLTVPELLLSHDKEEDTEQKPMKVELVPPPFVQINPFANQERVNTIQEGAQNQRAAQESEPDPNSRAEGPQLEGEDPRFNRIISGNPEAPDVAPAPLASQGDSDSPNPPAAGSAPRASGGNSFELQTRAEYLQQQANATAAQTQPASQSTTPPPSQSVGETTAQAAATAAQQTGTAVVQPTPPAAQQQSIPPAAQQQQAAPVPQTAAQQAAMPTPQTAVMPPVLQPAQQPDTAPTQSQPSTEPAPQTPTAVAKPEEQLTEEGLPPVTLPVDETATPAAPLPTTQQPAESELAGQTPPTPEAAHTQETPPDAHAQTDATALPQQPDATVQQPEPSAPAQSVTPLPEPVQMPEPAEPESAQVPEPPAPAPVIDEPAAPPQPEQAVATPGPNPQGTEDTPAIDPNAPRPRPRLEPRISAGPLRDQSIAANARGLVAIDSRFSEFGAYQQRMIEAISQQWYMLARQSRAIDSEYGTQVVLVFTMNDQGNISDTKVRFTNASAAATLLCINAVESRSPFGPWTADMKRVLGDSQTVTFTFYYR